MKKDSFSRLISISLLHNDLDYPRVSFVGAIACQKVTQVNEGSS